MPTPRQWYRALAPSSPKPKAKASKFRGTWYTAKVQTDYGTTVLTLPVNDKTPAAARKQVKKYLSTLDIRIEALRT